MSAVSIADLDDELKTIVKQVKSFNSSREELLKLSFQYTEQMDLCDIWQIFSGVPFLKKEPGQAIFEGIASSESQLRKLAKEAISQLLEAAWRMYEYWNTPNSLGLDRVWKSGNDRFMITDGGFARSLDNTRSLLPQSSQRWVHTFIEKWNEVVNNILWD